MQNRKTEVPKDRIFILNPGHEIFYSCPFCLLRVKVNDENFECERCGKKFDRVFGKVEDE